MVYRENHMKPNDDKCNLLATTEKLVNVNIDGSNVKKPQRGTKVLGTKFDSCLLKATLQASVKKLVKNCMDYRKIVNYIDLPKRKILMKAFNNYIPTQLLFINLDFT